MRTPSFFVCFCLCLLPPIQGLSQVSVLTYHNDNARTGQNVAEAILVPTNVNQYEFGKLFSHNVDGAVYAQPLYVSNVVFPGSSTHNVVYVATQHNSVYAFDADDNTGGNAFPLWSASLGNAVPTQVIFPELGILGTPVIDSNSNTLYVVAFTLESGSYFQRLHALDLATGQEKFGGPVEIQASVSGTGNCSSGGTVSFSPVDLLQRPGLLLVNGVVYISWAGATGCWDGWVIAYDAGTLLQVGVFNATPGGYGGGVWQSGAAPAADGAGSFYLETGDGTFDANTGGKDYGDSVLKLNLASSGLTVADYFTPHDQEFMRSNDQDLGSAGTLLLPDQPGAHPHLLVASSKLGSIYLLDRDNMGHFNPANDTQIVQPLPGALAGEFGMPAYWNNTVYFLGSGIASGSSDTLKAFSLSNGLLSTSPTSQSIAKFKFPDATVSVSANGQTNGIVWFLDSSGFSSSLVRPVPAVLFAYNANNLAMKLYDSNQAGTRDQPTRPNKFTVPTVANGKVYVGSRRQLTTYGLLSMSIVPGSLSFKNQLLNTQSAPQTVRLTNGQNTTLSIGSISTTGDYGQTNTCGSGVLAGAYCTITVTFTPVATGPTNGAVTVTDGAGNVLKVVSLSGTALAPVGVSPTSLAFGTVAVGTTSAFQTVTLTNNQNASLTISGIAASGDYAETDTCAGSVAAKGICKITVTFAPTNTGAVNGAVTITDGVAPNPQMVSLSGAGSGTVSSTATLSPRSIFFGNQVISTTSMARPVTLTNVGSTTLTISGIVASGNYSQTNTCGGSLAPTAQCTISVKFSPQVTGTLKGAITITDSASTSPQVESLLGTGVLPVTLFPNTLTFGNQGVGTISAVKTATMTNNQSVPLSVSTKLASGNYTETDNCVSPIAAKGTCQINVTFAPTDFGPVNGAVTITDSATSNPQVINLSGSGARPVTLSPPGLIFDKQAVGTTSAPKIVTLFNYQTTPLSISSIVATGDFAQTNTCGSSVPAESNCSISITFTPTGTGSRGVAVFVSHSAPSSPDVVNLVGTGI